MYNFRAISEIVSKVLIKRFAVHQGEGTANATAAPTAVISRLLFATAAAAAAPATGVAMTLTATPVKTAAAPVTIVPTTATMPPAAAPILQKEH